MRGPIRLRTRLLLTYVLLIAIGFGGLAWLAGGQIATATQEDFISALQVQTELAAHTLDEHIEDFVDGSISRADLARILAGYATELEGPVVLLDNWEHVIMDSQGQEISRELWQMPEIKEALAGRTSHAMRLDRDGTMTVFAAAPINERGDSAYVIQVARPLSAQSAAVRQRRLVLAGWVLVLALAAVAASLVLAASLTHPLEALRAAALRLAAGDLDQRLPSMRQDEIGQVATAFNTMAAQVQSMVEEQRAFAANASHELRTPLTTIRLRSEALRSQELEPALVSQYIAEIDDEASRLSGLVEDLILLARLDAGRAMPGTEEMDVARVARRLIHELESLSEAEGIELKLMAPPNLPTLTASIHHLRVVLRNLLSNALKYTPAEGVVTCALDVEHSFLKISVTDTGQGIVPDDLPHVTKRFYRGDKAHTRAATGSGLGLALVQSIVDCYGGRFEITSPGLGRGTSARVWWPWVPVPTYSRS